MGLFKSDLLIFTSRFTLLPKLSCCVVAAGAKQFSVWSETAG